MNSDYKWKVSSSRLNGAKTKESSYKNSENVSTINSFIRKHQRNLSLPINSFYEPTTPGADTSSLNTISNTQGNGISHSSPVHKNYQKSNDCDDDTSSNSDTSTTGTYIIEKNDATTDIKSEPSRDFDDNIDDFKKSNSMVKKLRSSWVNEWHSKLNQRKSSLSSALPVPKSDFKPNSPVLKKHTGKSNIPLPNASSIKDLSENSLKSTSSDDDTKLLLKDAENCVSMMEAKVDKTAFTAIQYNRTFNLRRDRFSKPLQDANKKNVNTKTADNKPNIYKPSNQNLSSSLSRVDCGRFSLRTSRAPQPNSSPLLSTRKNLSSKKKWNSSILCSKAKVSIPNKETELENWKRRKNYDPMKSAAQGKKKDLQKQLLPKEKSGENSGNPVLRSASFHGRDVFSQEDDNNDAWEQKSLHFYQPIDDWHKLPQPPATSRDHSPPPNKNENLSSANSSLSMLPNLISAHNRSPTFLHKSPSAFNSSTSSSLDVSSMPDALFDDKDTLDMVQLSDKAKKRGVDLMKRIRNELPEYDAIELTKGIGSIDIMDTFHIPMKSWGMSVSATNINCIESIFRILESVLFKDSDSREDNSDN